jgi:hypothetical protein
MFRVVRAFFTMLIFSHVQQQSPSPSLKTFRFSVNVKNNKINKYRRFWNKSAMSFPRFSQFFKWKSSGNTRAMKTLFRNQLFVYFWSSRIKKRSFHIYNFYMKRFQEHRSIGFLKIFKFSPVSEMRINEQQLNYIKFFIHCRLSNFSFFVINFFLWYQPWDFSQLKIGKGIAFASMMS